MSNLCREVFVRKMSCSKEVAKRQEVILSVIAGRATRFSRGETTNLAIHSPTSPIASCSLVYRNPRPCLETQFKHRNLPLFQDTKTKTGIHHHLCSNKRAFSTATIFKQTAQRPKPEMLAKYYARFMSTARSSLFGADGDQVESGEVAELLSNPKANKSVTINACGKLYAHLKKIRPILYAGAPTDGIQFDVQYYDSLDLLGPTTSRQKYATVCLLHGAPGHYTDYTSLINYLTGKGIRVIAPNFPDYSATTKHSFRHSPHERLEFLLEFFKAIAVSEYDMVIAHSGAVYTMYKLLDYSLNREANSAGIRISSLGLFCTPSHVLPHNMAVTPSRLFFLKVFDYPILRPFFMAFVNIFVAIQDIRVRVDKNKIDDLLISASVLGYSDHTRMANHLKLARQNKIPTLLVYGTKDSLITKHNFMQLERELGISSDDQVKRYNSDGTIESEARDPKEAVEVCRFESGGHYTFQKYSSQVNKDVLSFLTRHVLEASGGYQATKL